MTHSNHKNVKGIVKVDDSLEWLQFWADRLDLKSLTIFGGEPLLHPEFAKWVKTCKQIFGKSVGINFNTNGYYLESMFDSIDDLFNEDTELSMVVSIQTGDEPYISTVKNNFELLKQKVIDYYLAKGYKTAHWNLWLDEYEINTKRWFRLVVDGRDTGIGFTTCEQYRLHWTTFYEGYAEEMRPVYDYNDENYANNHAICQTSDYFTLYNGRMYKCPPIGVIEHTLKTFDLTENESWKPYLDNITTVGPGSTDEELAQWFDKSLKAEKLCNMCGFTGPRGGSLSGEQRSHILKTGWKLNVIKK
jgi:hypothetical protein